MGVILIGMPGIEKRLARYPQLYSRIGFVHEYRPLSAGELAFVLHWAALGLTLSADDFTDTEAIAAVHRITSGNFRLVHRLFAQITRVPAEGFRQSTERSALAAHWRLSPPWCRHLAIWRIHDRTRALP